MSTEKNDLDIDSLIRQTASQPHSYENDGEKITNHSLPELIEAQKYLTRKKAARNPFKALKVAKIITQGPEA